MFNQIVIISFRM